MVSMLAWSSIWKSDGPWKATVTHGRVGEGHGNVSVDRTLVLGLLRDVDVVGAALPVTPVLLDELEYPVRLDVAGHDDGGLLRAVPAVEEGLRVIELVGHVLDVF